MRIFLSFLLVIFPVYGICSDISWDTGYPSWNYWHKDVTEISYETVYEVQEALQTSVIEKLDRVELIQLTLVEAQQLTGMKYESEIEAEPFLVRSIYMHEFTGEYRIYIFEGELLVTHESLGAQIPVSKRGLVVNLAKRPRKIFVTAGTDL